MDPVVTKPKRPLSSFNLFYRFKRQKVIALHHTNNNNDAVDVVVDKETITNLVKAEAGMEEYSEPGVLPDNITTDEIQSLRRANIVNKMRDNLLPREDTRSRSHRTNKNELNGAISFVELGRLMNSAWKECDAYAKSIFNELSGEGRMKYQERLREYKDYAARMGLDRKDSAGSTSTNSTTTKADGTKESTKKKRKKKRKSSIDASDSEEEDNTTEKNLRTNLGKLEGELQNAKLRLRVMELEACLARQTEVENQLRSQIQRIQQHGGMLPNILPAGACGLLNLVSASNLVAPPSPMRHDSNNATTFYRQDNKRGRYSYPDP